jgi:uncharacterized repeat protein (TIGR01451 family)
VQVEVFPDVLVSQGIIPNTGQVVIGDIINVAMNITNQGTGPGMDVSVLQELPTGMQYVAAAPSGEQGSFVFHSTGSSNAVDECHRTLRHKLHE